MQMLLCGFRKTFDFQLYLQDACRHSCNYLEECRRVGSVKLVLRLRQSGLNSVQGKAV